MKFSSTRFRHKIFRNRALTDSAAKRTQPLNHNVDLSHTPEDLDLAVPEWFLEYCVKTAQELNECNIPLTVRNNVLLGLDSGPGGIGEPSVDSYEVDLVVYEPLLNVLSSWTADRAYNHNSDPKPTKFFLYDAVHLHLPDKHRAKGGSRFLTAIVEHFAKDAGADLITFGLHDIDDLVEHFIFLAPTQDVGDVHRNAFIERYFGGIDGPLGGSEDMESGNIEMTPFGDFPFSVLLSSPNIKRARSQLPIDAHSQNPLIIHISNIYSVIDIYGVDFLKALCGAIPGTSADALIISTTDQGSKIQPSWGAEEYSGSGYNMNVMDGMDCARTKESTVLRATGTNSRLEAICMAPISNRSQRILFDKHRKLEESYERENIRLLQLSIRRVFVELRNLPIVQPFADWSFVERTPTQKLLKHKRLDKEVVDLVGALHQGSNEEHIKEAILRLGLREKALDDWCSNVEDEASKGSCFSTETQSIISQIEKDHKFKWERRFLDLLINPDDVEEGWPQIALESHIKEAIVRLIHQPSNRGTHAYGILKHGRVGGALLYGPPGTGKTHLARVLARESKAITICASAADIENKYIGETEKAIQGLFSLGRMLSPCTIFIDEADALFRSRKSDDRNWERSQMNQLLYEMDGLRKSKTPPFVLLATNFPHELDHAVLRRVPSRIHIGLPSPETRRQIFQICFADEVLHPDIDHCYLIEKSRGYSGSDINTVCVQAALICDTIVGDGDTRRILKQQHFEKAFQRSSPTVSKKALDGIRSFAKEFDPSALDYMGQKEDTCHMPNRPCLRCEERRNARGRDYPVLSFGPIRLDLGLGLPKTKPTGYGRSETAASKAEEASSQANRTAVVDSETPYQYTPLKPDRKQARVSAVRLAKRGRP